MRPETRDIGTTTAGLPKRPLCVTGTIIILFLMDHNHGFYSIETQVIERFEKTEKVRRDSTSSTG